MRRVPSVYSGWHRDLARVAVRSEFVVELMPPWRLRITCLLVERVGYPHEQGTTRVGHPLS